MEPQHNFTFPLFVRLDDGAVMQIESYEKILYELEAIDIENDEFRFWDAEGRGVRVLIKKSRVSELREAHHEGNVQDAIAAYARQLGTSLDATGTPLETWRKLQEYKDSLPPRRGLLSRLFGRRRR